MPVKFGISFNIPTLNQAGALVHVYTDGSVHLNHGGTEMGQGLFVKVAQVVAEVFQVDLDRVNVTATSHRQGAEHLAHRRLVRLRSQRHGGAGGGGADQSPHDRGRGRAFRGGRRTTSSSPTTASMPATAACRSPSWLSCAGASAVSLSATGFYKTPKIHWDPVTNTGRPFYYFAMARRRARSPIDTLTGETRVLRAELVQDCGKSLNPAIDLGQIEGAFVQGMGWLTSEELWWDDEGALSDARPLHLQNPRQPRRAADLQCPHPYERPEPRGHDLPLQGRRRAAADAGAVGVARHLRCRLEPFGGPPRCLARRAGDAGARVAGGRGHAGRRRKGLSMFLALEEFLGMALRFLHVVAGIAWIGSSFYFIALDLSLKPRDGLPAGVKGEAWQVHGGGFYHMVKYLVAPARMPDELTWFKWEAYTTWLSGFALLIVVYYWNARLFLVDADRGNLSETAAIALSLTGLVVPWLAYEALCRSPLKHRQGLVALIGYVALVTLTFVFTQVFSGRGAFVQIGALIGTIMVASVLVVIIPNQKKIVEALVADREPDPALGAAGKLRSVHNNYLTLPVVFLMISNHSPLLTSGRYNWLIVAIVLALGPVIRHFFNARHEGRKSPWWTWVATAGAAFAIYLLSVDGWRDVKAAALPRAGLRRGGERDRLPLHHVPCQRAGLG